MILCLVLTQLLSLASKKQKFSAFIGESVSIVFRGEDTSTAVRNACITPSLQTSCHTCIYANKRLYCRATRLLQYIRCRKIYAPLRKGSRFLFTSL